MISADIPMTMNSTADLSLSIPEFIEYSIKNDLNIVTVKWLAHTKKLPISEAKNALKNYWESTGKEKGFSATFSVLSQSETENCFFMKLMEHDKLDNNVKGKLISLEIYAIHAIPLKDKSVQLGMINAPIFDFSGEIEAPWIEKSNNEIIITNPPIESLNIQTDISNTIDSTTASNTKIDEVASQPPEKKMKMIQKTRTFMHDGYQQVETYNELVPCDDEDLERVRATENPDSNFSASQSQAPAPQIPAQPKSKQSSMMSFFKKK